MPTAHPKTSKILAAQIREAMLDHEAFEQLIKPCELTTCRATCCHDGVYLSGEESENIKNLLTTHADQFANYGLTLPENPIISVRNGKAQKTATRPALREELAADYPKHFPQTRCVFLDSQGRCGIQRFSMEQGRGDWFDKPLTCWIHPIVILPETRTRPRPVITLVSPENDPQKTKDYPGFASCTHCGRRDNDGIPAREALMPELKMLGDISNRDLLAELNAQSF